MLFVSLIHRRKQVGLLSVPATVSHFPIALPNYYGPTAYDFSNWYIPEVNGVYPYGGMDPYQLTTMSLVGNSLPMGLLDFNLQSNPFSYSLNDFGSNGLLQMNTLSDFNDFGNYNFGSNFLSSYF